MIGVHEIAESAEVSLEVVPSRLNQFRIIFLVYQSVITYSKFPELVFRHGDDRGEFVFPQRLIVRVLVEHVENLIALHGPVRLAEHLTDDVGIAAEVRQLPLGECIEPFLTVVDKPRVFVERERDSAFRIFPSVAGIDGVGKQSECHRLLIVLGENQV